MLSLFARFLRFGVLAWGGPVAQIAMLRRELVDEEQWLSSARFNRLLAVYQVLPGPEAHELAVHLGFLRAGRLGGLLAGLGFMLPGFVLVLLAAALYASVDLRQPSIAAALLGVQVAVIALLIRAVERIGRHILVDRWTWAVAAGAALATLARVPFWIVLPASALILALASRRPGPGVTGAMAAVAAVVVVVAAGFASGEQVVPSPPAGATEPTLPEVLLSGLKAGLLTFGGAYTAIPFVRGDAVGGGWISDGQFLDALALSGVLPAPLIMFAAFVGFVAAGPAGAIVMTLGIFLPAFAFALVLGDRLEALVARPGLHRLLEGVAAGVVGIIAVTSLDVAVALAGRLPSLAGGLVVFVAALALLYGWTSRAAVPLAIAGGGALGLLLLGTPAA